jgi:hypothetical protein
MFFVLNTAIAENNTTITKTIPVDKKIIQESERFISWNDLTVLDKKTKLLWEVKSLNNRLNQFYWFKAEGYCDSLHHAGHNNWQLPTIKQLKTLLSRQKTTNNGYIDSEFFPQNISNSYWSSTEGYGHGGWYVDFDFGSDSAYEDSKKKYARCVIKSISNK